MQFHAHRINFSFANFFFLLISSLEYPALSSQRNLQRAFLVGPSEKLLKCHLISSSCYKLYWPDDVPGYQKSVVSQLMWRPVINPPSILTPFCQVNHPSCSSCGHTVAILGFDFIQPSLEEKHTFSSHSLFYLLQLGR